MQHLSHTKGDLSVLLHVNRRKCWNNMYFCFDATSLSSIYDRSTFTPDGHKIECIAENGARNISECDIVNTQFWANQNDPFLCTSPKYAVRYIALPTCYLFTATIPESAYVKTKIPDQQWTTNKIIIHRRVTFTQDREFLKKIFNYEILSRFRSHYSYLDLYGAHIIHDNVIEPFLNKNKDIKRFKEVLAILETFYDVDPKEIKTIPSHIYQSDDYCKIMEKLRQCY